jgi:hypothetical protein
MILRTVFDEQPLDGILRYVNADHSFSFEASSPADVQERVGTRGVSSLSVGTLQIEVSVETGAALFVWGYHPRATWELRPIDGPNLVPGSVRIDAVEPLESGVSINLQPTGAWNTWLDRETGWVRVTKSPAVTSESVVLIATDVALGVSGSELDAIWLRPSFD